MPFADDTFDVIFSDNVFDNSVYSQDQELMLKEITRVLKHRGVYVGGISRKGIPLPKNLQQISPTSSLLRKI